MKDEAAQPVKIAASFGHFRSGFALKKELS
jgi:hypothetical protein